MVEFDEQFVNTFDSEMQYSIDSVFNGYSTQCLYLVVVLVEAQELIHITNLLLRLI